MRMVTALRDTPRSFNAASHSGGDLANRPAVPDRHRSPQRPERCVQLPRRWLGQGRGGPLFRETSIALKRACALHRGVPAPPRFSEGGTRLEATDFSLGRAVREL